MRKLSERCSLASLERWLEEAILDYLEYKAAGGGHLPQYSTQQQHRVKELFAKLIGANRFEISFIPSTMIGENLIVSGLGLPAAGGNIVTDALHFEGSLYLYGELQRRVRVCRYCAGVGAVPFDVRSCGVDSCAAASYKWLMGDMGPVFSP